MMAGSGRLPFYVVFSDGNSEMNVGNIMVDPTMNFQSLLSLLSQKIGILPYQCNVFLATIGSDRRIPITSKFNLPAMLGECGKYYFFVERSRKKSPSNGDEMLAYQYRKPPLPRPTIMNRAKYERRKRDFQTVKESFLTSTDVNDDPMIRETLNGSDIASGSRVCDVCWREKMTGIDTGFHLCVHDEVTVGFRTTVGPISRPVRKC